MKNRSIAGPETPAAMVNPPAINPQLKAWPGREASKRNQCLGLHHRIGIDPINSDTMALLGV